MCQGILYVSLFLCVCVFVVSVPVSAFRVPKKKMYDMIGFMRTVRELQQQTLIENKTNKQTLERLPSTEHARASGIQKNEIPL